MRISLKALILNCIGLEVIKSIKLALSHRLNETSFSYNSLNTDSFSMRDKDGQIS